MNSTLTIIFRYESCAVLFTMESKFIAEVAIQKQKINERDLL